MLYTEFTVGNETYKLRLNTRNIVSLEKQLGCNPLAIFGKGDRVPTITEMVYILYAALQPLNHGISLDKTFEIFDKYLEENSATDFIPLILEIYETSGLVSHKKDNEKN